MGSPGQHQGLIAGSVRWVERYAVQASLREVATGATVSLIDPEGGETVATTLTDPAGSFSLDLAGWVPQTDRPYLLEAVKGLAAGGLPNRAGASGARVRTFVSKGSGGWTSVTGPRIEISRSSTALGIISSLKGLSLAQIQSLIGKVTVGAPDTYTPSGQIAGSEYSAVWGLVDSALLDDKDPVRSVGRDAATGAFMALRRGTLVTDLSAFSGSAGQTLTLSGTGFDLVALNDRVFFNGVMATGARVNGTGTELSVTIPDGASTGPLTVRIGTLVTIAADRFKVTRPLGTIATFAGTHIPPPGTTPTGWAIDSPDAVAADSNGNVYIAFSGSGIAGIYKLSASGDLSVAAGSGGSGFWGDGGPATAAALRLRLGTGNGGGLALDAGGNLYIADTGNHRIRKVDTATGIIRTVAGNGLGGYSGDNVAATSTKLYNPVGVALDKAGNLFIADYYNRRVRRVDAVSGIISTVAGNGTSGYAGDGGAAPAASMYFPIAVALDSDDNLYIADSGSGESRIRRVDASTHIITSFAGLGPAGFSGDGGPAVAAKIDAARSLAVDAAKNLYIVADRRVRKVTPSGTISTFAGTGNGGFGGDGGPAANANIDGARGIAAFGGNVYLADNANQRLRRVDSAGKIATIAGNGNSSTGDGGPASAAQMLPSDVACDTAGNVFVSDYAVRKIRRIDTSSGIITTVAGNGSGTYSGDGKLALNSGLSPAGIVADAAGNLLIADEGGSAIRRLDMTTGRFNTIAGTTYGYSGDGGLATAAQLKNPQSVALDSAGNLFIADTYNQRIRRVDAVSGVITTVAGSGASGAAGDGGSATSAQLNAPSAVAIGGSGVLYIADRYNYRIRKVDSAGNISTYAMMADTMQPADLLLDGSGNLLVADYFNHRILKFAPGGTASAIAGTKIAGYSSADDGNEATAAMLYGPTGIAFGPSGELFIAEQGNRRIRKVF